MATVPMSGSWESNTVAHSAQQNSSLAESVLNTTIPYVDTHYGYADGVIDPWEYAYNYTDPVTGITVYMEQNSTELYIGLAGSTDGWMAFGWKNYTETFRIDGLNNSDIIYGYAPSSTYQSYTRATLSDVVSASYELRLRNGTVIQTGTAPADDTETPLGQQGLLKDYIAALVGMRIGEVRHFIIPASRGYTTSTDLLYGEDLEYVITLKRINSVSTNPSSNNAIVYSDAYGISTFQHLVDADQTRVADAGGTDDGSRTQLEYIIHMNSTDEHDIPLLSASNVSFPLVLMYGANDAFDELPVQHSNWVEPLEITLVPNQSPTLTVESPEQDANLNWIVDIKLNATDDTIVRRAFYKFDDENWTEMSYDSKKALWIDSIDLTPYSAGAHTIWLNATDGSEASSVVYVNITVVWDYTPLKGMKASVLRTLTTKLYHSTSVSDQYTVLNNGTAPINAFEFFLSDEYQSNILSMKASDSSGRQLAYTELNSTGGYLHWRVYFAEPVEFQASYAFTITWVFHSLHKLTNFDRNQYQITFQKVPTVPYVLVESQFALAFRSGDSLFTGTPNPDGTLKNLAPMQNVEFTATILSYTPFIVCDRHTTVLLDPWGWITYKETITIHNIGPAKENTFSFTLPTYTSSVRIYDEVGLLVASQPTGTWALNDTINLNINLIADRFGSDGFWPGYSYTFHIDYTVQASEYQTDLPQGLRLAYPMGTFGDVLLSSHTVDIVLSSSVGVVEASGNYRILYGVFDNTLRYTFVNTTQEDPAAVVLVYQTSVLVTARPVVFALIIGLIASVYVFYRRLETDEVIGSGDTSDTGTSETRQSGAPAELLSEFAKLYSRKTALNLDLEQLEASRRRGKVSKKEYMIREKDLKTQMDVVDNKLPSVKDSLQKYGAKYRDQISQLELQEEKIEGAKAGLRQLLLRKKKQRISRVAFEKSKQDYMNTIKKATSATDRILLSIEEEAGEI
jgi:hypothetical protein